MTKITHELMFCHSYLFHNMLEILHCNILMYFPIFFHLLAVANNVIGYC